MIKANIEPIILLLKKVHYFQLPVSSHVVVQHFLYPKSEIICFKLSPEISIKFSSDQIRENLRLFGFGEYLNMSWLSNNSGIMIDAAKLYDIDKASLGYGYGLTSNSLQLARAYSAFANEGVMIEPKLYLDDQVIRKRILTKSNADFINCTRMIYPQKNRAMKIMNFSNCVTFEI